MSIIAFLFKQEKETGVKINRNYATAMMLITSFAASIGGLATPIGTPPNVIGLGFIRQITGRGNFVFQMDDDRRADCRRALYFSLFLS
jgi:di/tricarboxylate transporter